MKNIQKSGSNIEWISSFLLHKSESKRKEKRTTGKNNLKKNKKCRKIQKNALYNAMFYGYY